MPLLPDGYFLHPVTGRLVSSRIVIDSFAPTANSYIHGVKLRLPPPDDETDDKSKEEQQVLASPATHATAAAKNSNKAPLSLRKTFPVILHTDREGQVILTNILKLGKAGGWCDTFIFGCRSVQVHQTKYKQLV